MKRLTLLAVCLIVGATSAWASVIGTDPGPFGNPIFVRGGFNGWGVVDEMTWNPTTESYSAVLSINAGSWEFKIADSGWANPDFGPTGDPNVTLGTPTDIGTAIGANFSLNLVDGGLFEFVLSDFNDTFDAGLLTVTRVPIPAALLLFGSSLAGLGFLRRRG